MNHTIALVVLLLAILSADPPTSASPPQVPALSRADLIKAGIPRGCRVQEGATQTLPDLDRDGTVERLVRCSRKNESEEAKKSAEHRSQPCQSVYLIYSGRGRPRADLQAAYCPGPHGARGLGSDEITIKKTTLTQETSGGSSWQWSQTCVQDLAPPRVLKLASDGDWILCPQNMEERQRRYDQGTDKVSWSSPLCQDPEGDENAECRTVVFAGSYTHLPLLTVRRLPPPASGAPSWDARCRLSLTDHGHVVRGAAGPSGSGDATVEVWGFDDGKRLELWLHAKDDRFVRDSPRWLATDHLELWLADTAYSYFDHCVPSARVKQGLSQYVIVPASSGARVIPSGVKHGGVITATSRWLPEGSLLVRVELDAAARKRALQGGFTLAYSDGDDGRRQKYLLASSQVRFDDARSLGRLGSSDCVLDGKGNLIYKPPSSCAAILH